ncbi:MAG TPA: nucleotide exchange factor GrpE [Candidatus Paceibacterota bacterium]
MDEDKDKKQEEDVVVEADSDLDDSVVAEENAAETIKKLRGKLKESEKKASEYLTGWQRAQADFVNYKKRDAVERQEFLKFAAEPVILDTIHVMDSFDMAFQHKEHWEKADKSWRDGVEKIYAQLKKSLEKHGVTIDDPVGKDFDPSNHLAVEMINVLKPEDDGKIVSVIQKGYLLNGKVIRPAKVKVGEHKN